MRLHVVLFSLVIAAAGCAAGPPEAADSGAITPDAGPPGSNDGGPTDAGPEPCATPFVCGDACCREGERCAHGGCVIDLGPCAADEDCAGDSYCDESLRCTPYETPPSVTNDPACTRAITIDGLSPTEQCRWEGPVTDGPFSGYRQVYSSPMVADFGLDGDPTVIRPSIVITTFTREDDHRETGGILRVLDGRTCEEQHSLTDAADRLLFASQNAIGDLDGDGRPEIVGTSLASTDVAGGVVAFGFDEDGQLARRWYGRRCDLPGEPRHTPDANADTHHGPAIHDLDDDGSPEVLLDMFVYDADGCLLNPGATLARYQLGSFAVVGDVDLDGIPELANGGGLYEWSATGWTAEPGFVASGVGARLGHVAIADFGDYPGTEPGEAEIVVVSTSTPDVTAQDGEVRVQTTTGAIVFGPFPLPAAVAGEGGRGGPPTVADMDGDGRPEIGVAGASTYTVFDLDCDFDGLSGPGCARVEAAPRGVLWRREVHDRTSSATGSSVFDFDGDGVAEVVYGDECFARVFNGPDGAVRFSTSASTRTGYEYPVIADVDGDFNTEIVVALTEGTSSANPCPSEDPLFTDHPVAFEIAAGIAVYRDMEDRWVASRPIWNQHTYSVTNVSDDGTIPATSAWMANHATSGLNNYRQNLQGDLEREGLADLTVRFASMSELCGTPGATTNLRATVCNRGTNPVADGARVVFYEGDPDDGAPVACETSLARFLHPSTCTEVGCVWTLPEDADPRGVHVVVDPDAEVAECRPLNNRGVIPAVYCDLI